VRNEVKHGLTLSENFVVSLRRQTYLRGFIIMLIQYSKALFSSNWQLTNPKNLEPLVDPIPKFERYGEVTLSALSINVFKVWEISSSEAMESIPDQS
jgi:hypothetical protein